MVCSAVKTVVKLGNCSLMCEVWFTIIIGCSCQNRYTCILVYAIIITLMVGISYINNEEQFIKAVTIAT